MLENIPTYVLAGPLGAGKTSIAHAWLRQRPPGERWAVLVNEFGEIGLDAALLGPETDGIAITEVAGGCVCCVNGAPFTVALSRLIRAARPHRLLIELSGLSHPRPLLEQLKAEPWARVLDLQPLVVVLDGHALLSQPMLPDPISAAMAGPCVIVLSKADKVPAQDRPKVEAALHRPGIWITEGILDWAVLASAAQPVASLRPIRAADGVAQEWSIGWTASPDRLLNREAIDRLLQEWPWVRAKGIIHSASGWHSTNLVQGDTVAWRTSEWRRDSRLELIFTLPAAKELLEQDWKACLLA